MRVRTSVTILYGLARQCQLKWKDWANKGTLVGQTPVPPLSGVVDMGTLEQNQKLKQKVDGEEKDMGEWEEEERGTTAALGEEEGPEEDASVTQQQVPPQQEQVLTKQQRLLTGTEEQQEGQNEGPGRSSAGGQLWAPAQGLGTGEVMGSKEAGKAVVGASAGPLRGNGQQVLGSVVVEGPVPETVEQVFVDMEGAILGLLESLRGQLPALDQGQLVDVVLATAVFTGAQFTVQQSQGEQGGIPVEKAGDVESLRQGAGLGSGVAAGLGHNSGGFVMASDRLPGGFLDELLQCVGQQELGWWGSRGGLMEVALLHLQMLSREGVKI
jgi:hypothetical protein